MSDVRYGLMILTGALADLNVDRDRVVQLAAGQVIDETEGSLTVQLADGTAVEQALSTLAALGLEQGEHVFALSTEVPAWLPAFTDAATNMVEHGG